jgi:hypothetical protein
MDGPSKELPKGTKAMPEVLSASNGHHWISYAGRGSGSSAIICCRDCGIVRRADDNNKPCKGVVTVEPRTAAGSLD